MIGCNIIHTCATAGTLVIDGENNCNAHFCNPLQCILSLSLI